MGRVVTTQDDPYLHRVEADLDEYVLLDRALCTCDPDAGLDTCGWDDCEVMPRTETFR